MYRLTERLGYRHVSDFLRDQTGGELAGWVAYLRVDDEAQAQRTALAIIKAFNGGKKAAASADDDDEEVIDTTKPDFAEKFKGFVGTPIGRQPQRSMPQRQTSTQILMG